MIATRILYSPAPRALSAITGVLKRSGFDIVCSFSPSVGHAGATFQQEVSPPTQAANQRASQPGQPATQKGNQTLRGANGALNESNCSVLELILRYTDLGRPSTAVEYPGLKELIREALASRQCEGLNIHLAFPKNYLKQWKAELVKPLRMDGSFQPNGDGRTLHHPEPDSHSVPIYDRYMESVWKWRDAFHSQPPDPQSETQRMKTTLANLLNDTYRRHSLGESSKSRHIVFLSSHFRDQAMIEFVEKEARHRLLLPVVARDLEKYDSKRKGIVDLIRGSTFFLGIWDEEGAQQFGDRWWPSPWLLWEFGVAEASGLPWRLLISSKIDPQAYARIAMDRQHYVYESKVHFAPFLGKALDDISESQRELQATRVRVAPDN